MKLLIFGLLIFVTGLMVMYLQNTSKKVSKKITWYEWLILFLGVFSILFSLEVLFDSIAERVLQAAFIGFAMFVVVGFILLVLFWRMFSKKLSSKASSSDRLSI